ncbi:hypothetical protein EV715DRAFT_297807 [Schizophyllum commune]
MAHYHPAPLPGLGPRVQITVCPFAAIPLPHDVLRFTTLYYLLKPFFNAHHQSTPNALAGFNNSQDCTSLPDPASKGRDGLDFRYRATLISLALGHHVDRPGSRLGDALFRRREFLPRRTEISTMSDAALGCVIRSNDVVHAGASRVRPLTADVSGVKRDDLTAVLFEHSTPAPFSLFAARRRRRANVVDAGDKCSVRPAASLPHLTSTSTSGLSSTVITTLHDSGDIPLRLAPFLPGHSDSKRQCRRRVPETGVPSPAAVPYEGCRGADATSLIPRAAGGMSAISRAENAMTEVYPRSCFAPTCYRQLSGREAHV